LARSCEGLQFSVIQKFKMKISLGETLEREKIQKQIPNPKQKSTCKHMKNRRRIVIFDTSFDK